MKVKDVCYKNSAFVSLINLEDSIEEVIKIMGTNKETRTLFVVDSKEKLMGVITIQNLFEALFDKLKPKVFWWGKEKRILARDIMGDIISVSLNDSLEDALRAAATLKIQDLPVCKDGKIVAELDCFELLYGLFSKKEKD